MAGLFDGTPLERPVTCEHCGKAMDACGCPRDADGALLLPRDQQARVRREKRRGKYVTVVTGLDSTATDLVGLAKELRSTLGAGGSVTGKGGEAQVEIQGDHRDRVVAMLKERGYPAKAAGG